MMTVQYIFNILGLLFLAVMLGFQVWNLIKYRDTNGAHRKRITFMASTLLLIVHEIRLIFGITTGLFLLGHIIFLFLLFDMMRVSVFFKWIRGKLASLFLILISFGCFAQDFSYVNRKAIVGRNISDITVTFRNDYYTDGDIEITAVPNYPVSAWVWEIQNSWTHAIVATSSDQNPTFTGSEVGIGYFDIILRARNGLDYYPIIYKRAFRVFPPKVSEGSADYVIDLSTGSNTYFLDLHLVDMSDKTIFIKGTSSNTFIHIYQARATAGHPFIIQKADDNTSVEWTGKTTPSIAPHAFLFEDCEYGVVNGFNADGTNGIKVHGVSGSTQVVYNTGKFTNIELAGLDVSSIPTVDAGAVAFIPTFNAGCNINNWYMDSLIMYRIHITDAGEEGFYVGENNQNAVGGFNPPMGRGMVIARCTVAGCGRDGIQPGGMIGFSVHDNDIRNWGRQKETSHESCISHNGGSAGVYQGNVCIGGKMAFNLQSGLFPFDKRAGDTDPLPTTVVGCIFASGTYDHTGGGAEPFFFYGQNNPLSGAGTWNFNLINCVVDTDLKMMEVTWANGGFFSNKWSLINNMIIKTGDAGDWEELNFVGNGAANPTGTVVNNLIRERGSDLSDLFFTDYDNQDFTITSLSSAVYAGSPTDLTIDYSGLSGYFFDGTWFPLDVPVDGFNFGAYSGYQKKTVTPP